MTYGTENSTDGAQRPPSVRASTMTLRVSRDGGRTWGRARTVREDLRVPPEPLCQPMLYPPCRCPRCREGDAAE